MAYAQAQADVELGALFVEQLRLGDGVTHHLIGAGRTRYSAGTPAQSLGMEPVLQITEETSKPFCLKMRSTMAASL